MGPTIFFGGGFTSKLPQSRPTAVTDEPINNGDGTTPLYPLGYGLGPPEKQLRDTGAVIQPPQCQPGKGVVCSGTTSTSAGRYIALLTIPPVGPRLPPSPAL